MEQPFIIAAFIQAFGEVTTLKLLYLKTEKLADHLSAKHF